MLSIVTTLRNSLIPVDQVPQLSTVQVGRLKNAHVTTAEDLVGQLQADPDGVGDLLDLDRSAIEKLKADATAALPAATRREFAEHTGDRYAYGALKPDRD
jgi:hypothetical protein